MKKIAKAIVVAILGWQVRRLRKRNQFRVIGVAGSIGKTSTKFAIAAVLEQKYRVQFQEGNYNDLSSVPLVFFGHKIPSLFNPVAWLVVFIKNETVLKKPYPYKVVIVELGTDGPGQIAKFKKYLSLDIGVVTAISPEHMEYFKSLDAVADEELQIAGLSNKLFVNSELCDEKYLKKMSISVVTYGSKDAESILTKENAVIAKAQLFSAASAVAVGRELGLSEQQIKTGLKSIKPINGRLRVLDGINNSTIIDDTYNSSPDALMEALNTLYDFDSPQKIAVLGSMNELGEFSEKAHTDAGDHCDPKKLEVVLTIGHDANKYLAPAAEGKGCKVEKFTSPYDTGEYLKRIIKPYAAVLAKGSQNGVFAEEAIKSILAKPEDVSELVRQSPQWLKIKKKQFSK